MKLVDHTLEIFGEYYGQVTEPAVRKTLRLLHERGRTPSDGVGEGKIRGIVVRPGRRASRGSGCNRQGQLVPGAAPPGCGRQPSVCGRPIA